MNLDEMNVPSESNGGTRDIENDKEMQAYATVLYLLCGLRNVLDIGRVEFIMKYIQKIFPILGKVGNIENYLEFCNPEDKDTLKSFVSMYQTMLSSPMSDLNRWKVLEKSLEAVKPKHEEDLLVASVEEDKKPKQEFKLGYVTNPTPITIVDSNNSVVYQNAMPLSDLTDIITPTSFWP